MFGQATEGYVHWCHLLIRKSARAMLLLVGMTVLAGFVGSRLPGGFLPDEDQGYLFLAVQLPDAASLQRTDEVCKQVEQILAKTPGVQSYNTIVGFSLLSTVYATYNGFFFVTFKDWGERKAPEEQYAAIKAHINRELRKLPAAIAFAFPPPAIPGVGTAGGVTFMLEDRSGSDIAFLAENTKRFMDAARERPEVGAGHDHVPAVGAAGLRRGRPRQGAEAGRRARRRVPDAAGLHGRLVRQLLQPLRAHLAGLHPGRGRVPHRAPRTWVSSTC